MDSTDNMCTMWVLVLRENAQTYLEMKSMPQIIPSQDYKDSRQLD
jgi:hypothetical protein